MTNDFWSHGHFGWAFIGFIAWCTAVLVATDFLWRVTKGRTVNLLAWMGAAWLMGVVAIGLAGFG